MLLIAALGIDMTAIAAAFDGPSQWAPVGLYATTVGILSTATLGASIRRGNERASWLGMAIFGWSFLLPGMVLMAHADPWSRAGVFAGAQLVGLLGAGIGRMMSPS